MIAKYLGPGSRSLARLAATCNDLYDLLLPCLLEKLDSRNILDHRFIYCKRDAPGYLEAYVKELDWFPVDLDTTDGPTPALVNGSWRLLWLVCKNLRTLKINMSGVKEQSETYHVITFAKVEVLELINSPSRVLPYFVCDDLFPNLRKITIDQIGGDEVDSIWNCEELAEMKNLEHISVSLATHHASSLLRHPSLLPKIKEFSANCNHCLAKLVRNPLFQPESITISNLTPEDDDEQWAQAQEIWEALAKMDSLKTVEASSFSADLFAQFGLPLNLVNLSVDFMERFTEQMGASALDKLRAKFPSSTLKKIQIVMQLYHCPARDSEAWETLVGEILFWKAAARKTNNKLKWRGGGHYEARKEERLAWKDVWAEVKKREEDAGVGSCN